jgi:uncharacterized repeat protein (TIGR01451 family)
VTCTVQLRNTGAVSTSASLTDAMPAGMTLVPGSLWWSSGEGSEDIGTVTWHGALIARGLAIVRFRVQMDPELELGYSVVNVAEIEDSFGNIYERSASSTIYSGAYPGMVYLPVVLKAAALPGSKQP